MSDLYELTKLQVPHTMRQHYVPKTLLRGFLIEDGGEGTMALDVRDGTVKRRNIDKVAFEKAAYDFTAIDGTRRSFERVYGYWEDLFGELTEAVGHGSNLNEADWAALTEFVFDLHTRNPRWRSEWDLAFGPTEPDATDPRIRGGLALFGGGHWASVAQTLQHAEFLHAPETYQFVLADVPVGLYSAGAPSDHVLLTPGPHPDRDGSVDAPTTDWDVRVAPFHAEVPLAKDWALVFRNPEDGDDVGARSRRDAEPIEVDAINHRALRRAANLVFADAEERLSDLWSSNGDYPLFGG